MSAETISLGLSGDELASLGGFTYPALTALAWMREAWLHADPQNSLAVEVALQQLLLIGHSYQRNHRLVAKVLAHGLDRTRAVDLLGRLGFQAELVRSVVGLAAADEVGGAR